MVNIKTGEVRINSNLCFRPQYTFEEFKHTPYYTGQDEMRVIYLDEKQFIDGNTYIVSFFFREGKIYAISLINCDIDFTEEKEVDRKHVHDKILRKSGVKSGEKYEWGFIESEYDTKSNISSINIYYSK